MGLTGSTGIVLLFLAAGAGAAHGQVQDARGEDPTPRTEAERHAAAPIVEATRIVGGIRIDGRLDEAAWQTAVPATTFLQTDPSEGQPATERTDVRILYDGDALLIGAFLHDRGPVTTRLARRDANLQDTDWFAVSLDGYHDHLSAYRFAINPSGVRRDEIMTGSSMFGGDTNWDPVWEGEARVVPDSGWVVEMRIPFGQLRFGRQAQQVWGIQIERRIGRNHESTVLAFTPRNERGGVARYGHLIGVEGIGSGDRNVELMPYVMGRADYSSVPRSSDVSFANPFRDGALHGAGAGVDLKYRPTSNVTISATVNPDFGQVELDPAVINLTAFETRFDEKRPFFVEGSDLFRFGGGDFGGRGGGGGGGAFGGGGGPGGGPTQLVYSRRIGRSPQVSVPSEAVYADVPSGVTILGAAKVTARTASGWSVGLIEAVTSSEEAAYVVADGTEKSALVEPFANYLAGRIRRDMRAGQTALGGLVTAVNRDLDDARAAARLRSSAYAGGLDFRHEWSHREWSFNGYIAGSHIRGLPAVMISAQRASARYFQRPDADHLTVDSSATSLSGFAGRFDIGKRAGTWRWNSTLSATSPGYEVNDMGFQTSADRVSLDVNLNYEQNQPGRVFRRWSARIGPDLGWNFGGDLINASLGVGGNGQLANYWNFGYNVNRRLESYDDRLTRGGALSRSPAETGGFLHVSTDSRKPFTVRATLSGNREDAGGWRVSSNLDFGLRPTSSLDLQIGPNLSRSRSTAQYVTTVSDTLARATFGRRYVFGDLDQTTLSIETRLNVTFTPALSLELFAQPFVSSGDYGTLKQLRESGVFAFDSYGSDIGTVTRDPQARYTVDPDGAGPAKPFTLADPDFNLRSLRGNAVLRWEWRPGSTLFLVWQQNRSRQIAWTDAGSVPVGNFDLNRDIRAMLDLRPDNVFMLKASYWINP